MNEPLKNPVTVEGRSSAKVAEPREHGSSGDRSGSEIPTGPRATGQSRGESPEATLDWLRSWRGQAWEVYASTPLPHRAAHLWRYTDPALFVLEDETASRLASFDPFAETLPRGSVQAEDRSTAEGAASPGSSSPSGNAPSWPEELRQSLELSELSGAGWVDNDRLVLAHLDADLRKAGARLVDLRTAASEYPHLLGKVLGSTVGAEFGKFEALNAATFRGGAFLYIPRGLQIEKPIHLVQSLSDDQFSSGRLAVLVDEGASVTLISEHKGGPERGAARVYHVTELSLGSGSRVQFALVQTYAKTVQGSITQRARLSRNASYTPVLASFGGSLIKVDAGTILEGDGSETEMTGFVSGVGKQRIDHHTVHHHLGQHTRSNLDFKTVLKDRSRSAYTGLIRIEKEASYTEAYQENRNLLLSETCRADSIPELEILTEEVQCKHGATVGPLNPEHIFYFMSRSIPRDEAIRMIVEGHFESALVRLPEGLQARLRAILRERLREI